LAQVAFDAALLLDDAADLPDVFFRQILDADVRAHAGRIEDVVRPLPADAVDVGQPDFHALRARQINACNTCHMNYLSLPLLVLLIRADHAHDALPAHDLALVTNPFYRRPDF